MIRKDCFQFGKIIPGLKLDGKKVNYRVLNEREVRAGAGIMFLLGSIGFSLAFFYGNYIFLKVVVVLFFVDFLIRVIWGTCPSLISMMARYMVAQQDPEWVGAVQKRFAWGIGLLMTSFMIVFLVILDTRGAHNLIICAICLTVMWLEASFGLCVGCKMYYRLLGLGIIPEPKERPKCAGGSCSIKKKGID